LEKLLFDILLSFGKIIETEMSHWCSLKNLAAAKMRASSESGKPPATFSVFYIFSVTQFVPVTSGRRSRPLPN